MTKFYKKAGPRTPILMPNGDALKFETLDGMTGFYKTEDENTIKVFDKCIKERRGAIEEISEDEYGVFSKKKETSPRFVYRFERESIGADHLQDTSTNRVRPVARAEPSVTVDTGKPVEAPALPRRGRPRVQKKLAE